MVELASVVDPCEGQLRAEGYSISQ
jgi:hypothetical protein